MFSGLNSRSETTEKDVNEIEHRSTEIVRYEDRRKNFKINKWRVLLNCDKYYAVWHTCKWSSRNIRGRIGQINWRNFSQSWKPTRSSANSTLDKYKENTLRDIIIKLQMSVKNKESVLSSKRGGKIHYNQRNSYMN